MSVIYGSVQSGQTVNPGSGNWAVDGNRIRFSRMGRVPVVLLTPNEGEPLAAWSVEDGSFAIGSQAGPNQQSPEDVVVSFIVYP